MPLVLTTSGSLVLARGSGTIEASDAALVTDAIDACVARRQKFLVVADTLGIDAVAPAARRHVGEHRNRHKLLAADLDLGIVVALRSPIVRGALTAIGWISGAFANLRTVEHRAELASIVRAVYGEKHVPLRQDDEAALTAFVGR